MRPDPRSARAGTLHEGRSSTSPRAAGLLAEAGGPSAVSATVVRAELAPQLPGPHCSASPATAQ